MLSSQEEQAERRRVFAQDQSLRNQGGTFHQHALAEAETPRGRFSAVSAAYVVGSTATPQYPQASTPFQSDPVPDEPPLGFDNPALEPLGLASSSAPVAQGNSPNPALAPSAPLDVEQPGLGLSKMTAQQPEASFPASGKRGHAAGSSRPHRRY